MSGPELRAHLKDFGWSQRSFAGRLGVHPNTVTQWALGRKMIPRAVCLWLEALAELRAVSQRVFDEPSR